MAFIDVTDKNRDEYNAVVNHPLQSYEWGEFRKTTGIKVIRRALEKNGKIVDGFSLTLHKIPGMPKYIGYLPKGNEPTSEILKELQRIGKEHDCVYIQLEPNVVKSQELGIRNHDTKSEFESIIHDSRFMIHPSFHPLFTRYTFVLDLQKTEEDLMKNMHSKTRYNIRVAQKHNVKIAEDNSEHGFEEYMKLTEETTKRQKFYAHTSTYHKMQWKILNQESRIRGQEEKNHDSNRLSYHLFHALYKDEPGKIHTLTSWVLFTFHDTLYYPYGSSSSEFRNVMASNLIAWEAIQFGKKLELKQFDMWGALGPNPDTKDPWYGFHRFKEGYGATLTEFIGSYDLIIDPLMYTVVKLGDRLRWMYLRLKK